MPRMSVLSPIRDWKEEDDEKRGGTECDRDWNGVDGADGDGGEGDGDPLNPCNCEITEEDVRALLRKYGVPDKIHNMALYRRAFVHSSYTRRPRYESHSSSVDSNKLGTDLNERSGGSGSVIPLKTKSNERLEFLGDGILECVVKFHIYRRFPKENEGFMTEKKIAVVKNVSIGKIAQDMGLSKWLLISRAAEQSNMRNNLKKLGCLFEALVGAIFLDANQVPDNDPDLDTDAEDAAVAEEEVEDLTFWKPNHMKGFHMAMRFIENVFQEHVDWVEILQKDDNYKAILQVQIQKEFRLTPHYMEFEPHSEESGYAMTVILCIGKPIHLISLSSMMRLEEMPLEEQNFAGIRRWMALHDGTICVRLGNGRNHNKRKAEQYACRQALNALALLDACS